MLINDIMTIGPATIGPDATIAEAGRFMLDRRLSALPVVDGEDRLLGIVTEGDLLRRPELGTAPGIGWWRGFLAPETSARDFVHTRGRHVGEVMTAAVETITTTTSLADAVALMERRRFKQVPVVQGAVLIGLLTRRDIIAALLDTLTMPSPPPSAPPSWPRNGRRKAWSPSRSNPASSPSAAPCSAWPSARRCT
jgi:CBS domain-containing protein